MRMPTGRSYASATSAFTETQVEGQGRLFLLKTRDSSRVQCQMRRNSRRVGVPSIKPNEIVCVRGESLTDRGILSF